MSEQHDIQVPKAQLQQMRQEMLQKVKKEKKRRQRLLSSTLLFVVLFSFVLSIRMSPTIASYVAKIPGFDPIVMKMVSYDKGVKAILDNDYFEEVQATANANGLTVTIVDVFADQSGMVVSYEVDAPFDIGKLRLMEVELFQDGKEVLASKSYGWIDKEPTQHVEDVIELLMESPMSSHSKEFELIFYFDDEKQTKIQIPFTLKNDIQSEKVITYNKEVDVNGQKFTIEKVRTSPLRIALDISVDPSNTMQLLKLEHLKLIDENGEKWGAIINGISTSGDIRDGHFTLYLQSNYFERPKQLTLEISSVYAIPKGQDFIEVDFSKQEVVSKPDYLKWQIDVQGKDVSIYTDIWGDRGRILLYKAVSNEKIIEPSRVTWEYGDPGSDSIVTYEEAEGLTKIDINFYSNIIGDLIEIPIPLNE
ncbi:MAG: DUF4179 domain-containing protein [Solibacillus sp.]